MISNLSELSITFIGGHPLFGSLKTFIELIKCISMILMGEIEVELFTMVSIKLLKRAVYSEKSKEPDTNPVEHKTVISNCHFSWTEGNQSNKR